MSYFEVGDRVEILEVLSADEEFNIKVGDVAKITEVINPKWFHCVNPNWKSGCMNMRDYQLKKVG